jgi:sodium-independent sulfate anion transporter 11
VLQVKSFASTIKEECFNPIGCAKKWLSKERISARLPILRWLPEYDLETGVSDLIAGLTVGLMVIPQGIAYAIVAGLPPQYGLYSAFMGSFVYCVLGSSKDVAIGPTGIMALMTGVYASDGPEYAVLLSFLSSLVILACSFLRLGFLIDFLSIPVNIGFTSAASITIASSQVKSLLGLTIPSNEKSSLHLGVLDGWIDIVTHITTCRWQDATLGLVCCVILLCLRVIIKLIFGCVQK